MDKQTSFYRLTMITAGSKKPKQFWVSNPAYKQSKTGEIAIFTQVSKEGEAELSSRKIKGGYEQTKGIVICKRSEIIKLEPAVLSLKYGELVVKGGVETKREGFY